MIKNNLIPFALLPGSWGLIGPAYQEAKAYYELDGIDLKRRIVDIRFTGKSNKKAHLDLDLEFDLISEYDYSYDVLALDEDINPDELLKLQLKHEKISQYDYDLAMAKRMFDDEDSIEYQSALLTADFRANKITKLEYDKTLATAYNEPWVGVVDNGYDASEGINGLFFELDWNDLWVDYLRSHGYTGFNDEQIVEQWFSDVCKHQSSILTDNQPVPFNSSRVINRLEDGDSTEYS